jgi:hypothetical protein
MTSQPPKFSPPTVPFINRFLRLLGAWAAILYPVVVVLDPEQHGAGSGQHGVLRESVSDERDDYRVITAIQGTHWGASSVAALSTAAILTLPGPPDRFKAQYWQWLGWYAAIPRFPRLARRAPWANRLIPHRWRVKPIGSTFKIDRSTL